MNSNPLVSIWCVTYNHEKYIKDAIENFLAQKTDFRYEIVIHDDASTDNTISILKEYEKKYPELIRVIYEMENQCSKYKYPPQFFYGIMCKELKGDYIAWCEGDDYWTDSNKLQMQIDYMETHPECVMTGHDAVLINYSTNKRERIRPFSYEKDLTYADALEELQIPTASWVFKRKMLYINEDFLKVGVGDYPLRLYCMTKGKIHYFDKAMSVYRYLSGGSWSDTQRQDFEILFKNCAELIFFLEKYNEYTSRLHEIEIKRQMNFFCNTIICEGRIRNLSIEQFAEISERVDKICENKGHKYYAEIETAYRQLCDPIYIAPKVAEFVKKNKYVLIWGAGDYAKVLAQQLDNNGLKYEGFVISDNQAGADNYNGKKIWKISECPFYKKNMGILIAVRMQLRDEILTTLQLAGIQKYLYPFDIILII